MTDWLAWWKVADATGYYIERKTQGTAWESVAVVKEPTVTDKAVTKGTIYKYRIRARQNVGGRNYYGCAALMGVSYYACAAY